MLMIDVSVMRSLLTQILSIFENGKPLEAQKLCLNQIESFFVFEDFLFCFYIEATISVSFFSVIF